MGIVIDPKTAFGKPIIKGTRITVDFILDLLASGWSIEEILEEYPNLTKKDVLECIKFAKETVQEVKFYPINILEDKKAVQKIYEDLS